MIILIILILNQQKYQKKDETVLIYDIIMIIAGIDRTVNIELLKPTIIVVDAGIRTTVNVKGGLALANSQAVLIAGLDNKVNGLAT